MLEVAAGGHPGDADVVGYLGGRELGRCGLQGPDHGGQGVFAHALGLGRAAGGAQGGQDPVDVLLDGDLGRFSGGDLAAVVGVLDQLVAQGRERERLEQVLHDPLGDGGPDHVQVAGRGDGDHVGGPALSPHSSADVQPGHVGQVDVEQDEVDLADGQEPQRLATRVSDADHLKAGHPPDQFLVGGGEHRVVLDHEHPDGHDRPSSEERAAAAASGRRMVNTAPPSVATSTRPSWRPTTWRTSASPSPRPCGRPPGLVDQPRVKACSSRPGSSPGPLSATRTSRSVSAWRTVTVTRRGAGAAKAASTALSIRLPTMVTRSRGSIPVGPTAVSSVTTSSTPRSWASAALPSSNATSTGSSTTARSWSARRWAAASSAVANSTAASGRPSSIRVTTAWSRLADS